MEKITIPSGERLLDGVLHTASGAVKPYVFVMCHGFRGSKDGGGKAVHMAEIAAAHGYTVLRFDFTPLAPLSQQLKELADVLSYIRSRFALPIIGLGRSMGGCALALSSSTASDVVGYCFWATPNNLMRTIRRALGAYYDEIITRGRIEVTDEYGHMTLERSFLDELADYDVERAMRMNDRPAIFIHGSADDIVLVEEGKRNYDVYRGEKEWYEVSGADHHIALNVAQTEAKLIDWLEAHFSI